MPPPVLETPRLLLRPLRSGDTTRFLELASDWDVARMTSDIPHPLVAVHARDWLRQRSGDVRFAIEHAGQMIGSAGYFRRRAGVAELGFWLGRAYWGRGFASEAAGAVVRHGFGAGRQQSFSSAHFVDNPASARVLAKLGFEPVGQSPIWCSARLTDVDAVLLMLSRERASAVLGEPPAPAPTDPAGLMDRIGRWLGWA